MKYLLLISLILLTSCGGKQTPESFIQGINDKIARYEKNIVGTWLFKHEKSEETSTALADGTWTSITDKGARYSGTWNIKMWYEKNLIIEESTAYRHTDKKSIEYFTAIEDITKDQIILKKDDDTLLIGTRIQPGDNK